MSYKNNIIRKKRKDKARKKMIILKGSYQIVFCKPKLKTREKN